MTIRDLMGGLDEIINPALTYPGDYDFSIIYLLQSSIVKKNKNLVAEYILEKYSNIFDGCLSDLMQKEDVQCLIMTSKEKEYGRELMINPGCLIISLVLGCLRVKLTYDVKDDRDALRQLYLETVNDIKRKLNEIKTGRKKISDYPAIYDYYKEFERYFKKRKMVLVQTSSLPKISDVNSARGYLPGIPTNNTGYKKLPIVPYEETFISQFLSIMKDLEAAYDSIYEVFENTPINLSELGELIDYDKFCLYLASRYMMYCAASNKNDNIFSYCAIYLQKYEKSLHILQKESNYSCRVKIPAGVESKGERSYSTKDFLDAFRKMKIMYHDEEFDLYCKIDENDGTDYRSMENVNKELQRLKDKKEAEILMANWEFIPKGSIQNYTKQQFDKTGLSSSSISEPRVFNEEKPEKETIDFSGTLEKTDYTYIVYGKDKFFGYKGFLYTNGFIIFERGEVVDGILQRKPENATYVMQLDNFREMTKLSKPEIIEYIKSGNSGVRRIYHTGSWKDKVFAVSVAPSYFDTSVYEQGILDEIKSLTQSGELLEQQSIGLKHNDNK